jgi:hypothetical protein
LTDLEVLCQEIRALRDAEEIREVFARFAMGMDAQDWDLLRSAFSEDVVVDHSHRSWDGPVEDLWVGIDEVMARMRDGVSKHFVSHHIITNHRARIEGDRARATTYLHSVHLDDPRQPAQHEDHGAWYLSELVRTDSGWRIARLKHIPIWREHMPASGPVTAEDIEEVRTFLS